MNVSAVPSIGETAPPENLILHLRTVLTVGFVTVHYSHKPDPPTPASRITSSTHSLCNTESDPHCVLIGSKLTELLTAKC